MVANRDQAGRAGRLNDGAGDTDRSVAIQVLMETGLSGLHCATEALDAKSQEMKMFPRFAFAPICPILDFRPCSAPPASAFKYLTGNVAFVS